MPVRVVLGGIGSVELRCLFLVFILRYYKCTNTIFRKAGQLVAIDERFFRGKSQRLGLKVLGRLECVIYVNGARVSTLLSELRHNWKYFRVPTGRFKTVVRELAAQDFSHLDRRLQNLKFMDLTRPCNPSNIHVHLREGSGESVLCVSVRCTSVYSTAVVVCLEKNRGVLVDVFKQTEFRDYNIVRASIEYEEDGGKKSEDIDVGTLVEDEREKISRILRVADERGCSGGNAELIVSGPSIRVHHDLMVSLYQSGLVVTGGQVYREFGTGLSDSSRNLVWCVSKKPTAGSR